MQEGAECSVFNLPTAIMEATLMACPQYRCKFSDMTAKTLNCLTLFCLNRERELNAVSHRIDHYQMHAAKVNDTTMLWYDTKEPCYLLER